MGTEGEREREGEAEEGGRERERDGGWLGGREGAEPREAGAGGRDCQEAQHGADLARGAAQQGKVQRGTGPAQPSMTPGRRHTARRHIRSSSSVCCLRRLTSGLPMPTKQMTAACVSRLSGRHSPIPDWMLMSAAGSGRAGAGRGQAGGCHQPPTCLACHTEGPSQPAATPSAAAAAAASCRGGPGCPVPSGFPPRLPVGGMSERRPVGAICVCRKMVCRGATDVSCRCTASRRSGPAGQRRARAHQAAVGEMGGVQLYSDGQKLAARRRHPSAPRQGHHARIRRC